MAGHKWTLRGDPDAGSQSYAWESYEVKWEWTGSALGDEGYWYATHHERIIKEGGTPPELMDFCESFSERLVTTSGETEDED